MFCLETKFSHLPPSSVVDGVTLILSNSGTEFLVFTLKYMCKSTKQTGPIIKYLNGGKIILKVPPTL